MTAASESWLVDHAGYCLDDLDDWWDDVQQTARSIGDLLAGQPSVDARELAGLVQRLSQACQMVDDNLIELRNWMRRERARRPASLREPE